MGRNANDNPISLYERYIKCFMEPLEYRNLPHQIKMFFFRYLSMFQRNGLKLDKDLIFSG